MNDKLQFIADIADKLDSKKQVEEFVDAFKFAIEQLLEIKKDILKDKKELKSFVETLLEIKKDILKDKKESKSFIETQFDSFIRNTNSRILNRENVIKELKNKTIEEKKQFIKEIEEKLKKIDLPAKKDLVTEVLQELPEPQEKTGNEIISTINTAKNKKIKKERIEGLDEMEKRITSKIPINGGIIGKDAVKFYDLSAQLDGSTKTFNLPAFWRVLSVHSSSFPNALRPTVDYTTNASDMTIAFTSEITASSTLASGQTLLVIYVSG